MLKNLLLTTMKIIEEERAKYFFITLIYSIFIILISWIIQFKIYTEVLNGKTLFILIAVLIISWFPFLLSIFFIKIFKLPLQMLRLVPIFDKKLIWGFLVTLLVAAIGFKFSLSMSQIYIADSGSPLLLSGDTIFSALNLSFPNFIPVVLFCFMISVGLEFSFRAFLIEISHKVQISHPWFLAGLIQFIAFFPFLWFGYFGGGERNIVYLLFWFILFISQSGFYFWLSLLPSVYNLDESIQKLKIDANRSLLIPILASCLYQNIYYVIATRTLTENGNLWMSGPANVITVVIYFIITIFLLMTKRLKY